MLDAGAEMTRLAVLLGLSREVIRIWFCNRRQATKNATTSRTRTHLSWRHRNTDQSQYMDVSRCVDADSRSYTYSLGWDVPLKNSGMHMFVKH